MTNQYKTPKEFFDECGEYRVELQSLRLFEDETITVRELYEHFRNQIFNELGIDEHKSEDKNGHS